MQNGAGVSDETDTTDVPKSWKAQSDGTLQHNEVTVAIEQSDAEQPSPQDRIPSAPVLTEDPGVPRVMGPLASPPLSVVSSGQSHYTNIGVISIKPSKMFYLPFCLCETMYRSSLTITQSDNT